MKRYLVFTYDKAYPKGGFGDYKGSNDSLLKAVDMAESNDDEIKQIVDSETMEVVWSYNWWEEEGKGLKV